jgi:hypothetical protein
MVRVLTAAFAAGVLFLGSISAQAAPILYTATLSGLNEVPANASPGTGFTSVTIDLTANTLRVQIDFSGLLGTTTNAHIHAAASPGSNAGVATRTPSFLNFPSGVTSGSYDMTYDMTLASTFNAAYITTHGGTPAGAAAALAAAMAAGQAYVNVHSTLFPGGELRGNLQAVPEPATLAMAGLGVLGVLAARSRRKRSRLA